MVESIEGVADIDFTVVYEPNDEAPRAIVEDTHLQHGPLSNPRPKSQPKSKKNKSIRARVLGRIRKSETAPIAGVDDASPSTLSRPPCAFWPRDMLPHDCPQSRILVYGYDSKVTKYMKAATNKNSLLSHAKDLLFALSRTRELDRPLILVAHSLGGIVVKEMLAQSSMATDDVLKNIVGCSSSVIFMGTPHRGSPQLAALGEWARSVVGSGLRMETNDAILNALNLKTTDLERAQESFSSIWLKHDFRVKTLQEGMGLTGVNLSVLGNKVVPDHSSLIGDARERAETIQANHMDMCRFTGPEDPNYAKLSGEIVAVYASLIKLKEQDVKSDGHVHILRVLNGIRPAVGHPGSTDFKRPTLHEDGISALRSLRYSFMNRRQRSLEAEKPAQQTCKWLFEQQEYREWVLNANQENSCGLISLKGKPGAGKSTLMHEAFRRAEIELGLQNEIAAFFFNAKGSDLEHSAEGLFRSLLHQLLPRRPIYLRQLVALLSTKQEALDCEEDKSPFTEPDLKDILCSLLSDAAPMTYIFIDALDECNPEGIRPVAYFCREITKSAPYVSICISSRHYPSISLTDCPEIMVENHNHDDIARYVDQRLGLGIADIEPEKQIIKDRILDKAAGVFLWVTLVVDDILQKRDEGKSLTSLLADLDAIPGELEALYLTVLGTVDQRRWKKTTRLFQWAVLATRPLRLNEWDHILAFMAKPPASLWVWRVCAGRMDSRKLNVEEIDKKLRALSKGLIEVRNSDMEDAHGGGSEGSSVEPGAGSLESGDGENRVVQVIHESVRELFLKRGGVAALGGIPGKQFVVDGHLAIMGSCLDYINVPELDGLVKARIEPDIVPQETKRINSSSSLSLVDVEDRWASHSVYSFGSAYSHANSRRARSSGPDVAEQNPAGGVLQPLRPEKVSKAPAELSVFEMLKKSSDEAWSRDYYAQRMMLYNIAADEISIHPSAVTRSVAGETRILDDYPALLSYAVFEMFRHARLAQDSGADPTDIIKRLQERDNRLWIRRLALAEDVPLSTGLFFHAAEQGLFSWMAAMDKCSTNRHRQLNEQSLSSVRTYQTSLQRHEHTTNVDNIQRSAIPVSDLMPALNCRCSSCGTLFVAMLEAVKRRNTAALERLSRYSQIGTLFTDSNLRTILHILARIPDVLLLQVEEVLLKHHSRFTDDHGRTALHIAIGRDNGESLRASKIAEMLLGAGAEVNAMEKEGHTALHRACFHIPEPSPERSATELDDCEASDEQPNILKLVDLLLRGGADIGAKSKVDATPLHIACRSGEKWRESCPNTLAVVKRLLDAGADPCAVTIKEETALHIAAARSTRGVAAELIRRGTPIMACDQLLQNALHHAAWAGNNPVAEEILESGGERIRINIVDNQGSTPLHFACQFYDDKGDPALQERSPKLMRNLLQRGATIHEPKNWLGLTPFQIAEQRGLSNVVGLLKEYGGDPPSQSKTVAVFRRVGEWIGF
ncbi:hypothetical protein QBC37DRAFT_461944 [Rhypophila decipiens]|uniref:Nephrocystin 3-like N-terminal domain-containing protein n=1 Tax=Rhypophila decipiens TaxID=261697 RepID=A0AAN7B833_9PEZI|nr:hypothetical protein QBC37DRAFT_461944 [Rhypophila decipiens]